MIKGGQKSYLLRGDGAEVAKVGRGGLGAHHFSKCGWTIMYLHLPLLLEKAGCLAWKQKLFNKSRDTRVLRVLLQPNNLYFYFLLVIGLNACLALSVIS